MASRMFARASSSVAPCDQHPGSPGQETLYPSLVRTRVTAGLAIFGFSKGQAGAGAAVVLSNDHFDGGRESALIAAQVIRGASPAQFPYRGITRTRLIVNPRTAIAARLRVPDSILRRAQVVK